MQKSTYEVSHEIASISNGGKIHAQNTWLYSLLDSDLVVSDLNSLAKTTINGASPVSTFCVSPANDGCIAISYQNSLTCIYIDSIKTVSIKTNLVLTSVFHPLGKMFAVGSFDSTVKIFNLAGNCTHNYKNSSLVSALLFTNTKLVSACTDGSIRIFDLITRNLVVLDDAHNSTVRGLCISNDGQYLFSSSRDSSMSKWRVDDGSVVFTVATRESIDAICSVVWMGMEVICTGGVEGIIKCWDSNIGDLICAVEGSVGVGVSKEILSLM